MQAYVDLPAPNGLDDDLVGRALYELSKLGTVVESPYGGSPVEVYSLPEGLKPHGAPKELTFLRLVANLIPSV